ncbi:hypothetical protein J5N97_023127 [Dioscorea zingiberensis]|uniref:Auxin-responsive protein n=1 Tax=Dioscorea zingiberensis TaxID=325984 RepID=A0A9D5CCJ8_9LILI|nr:hypothetical protein J5N97_023127 [Dioscorea zingiberensis]
MNGDPIGRKVDLNAHNSYDTLAHTLSGHVFTYDLKASKMLDGSSGFSLTYEDRDGDWMLVGDVPWGMFLSTVKRLRIMRTSDTNGLGELGIFSLSSEFSGALRKVRHLLFSRYECIE